jgi:hypothetical protein
MQAFLFREPLGRLILAFLSGQELHYPPYNHDD